MNYNLPTLHYSITVQYLVSDLKRLYITVLNAKN